MGLEFHSTVKADVAHDCELLPATCRPGCAIPRYAIGAVYALEGFHYVARACLAIGEAPRRPVRLAYLFHGFVYKSHYRSLSKRQRKYALDIRNYWEQHELAINAMRAASTDVWFAAYTIEDKAVNATFSKWLVAHSKGAFTVPYFDECGRTNCSQFSSAGKVLTLLPTYDYYVVSRIDITFTPAFVDMLRALELNFTGVVALNQEVTGGINDVWFSFPNSERDKMSYFFGHVAKVHAHFIHTSNMHIAHKRLNVSILSPRLFNQNDRGSYPFYHLGGNDANRTGFNNATCPSGWILAGRVGKGVLDAGKPICRMRNIQDAELQNVLTRSNSTRKRHSTRTATNDSFVL